MISNAVVSSTNLMRNFQERSWLLAMIVNRITPKLVPCGMPPLGDFQSDIVPPILTACVLLIRNATIYFIISVSDKQLSSFFISLILSLFSYIFFFPYHFCFNFVVSERNLHIIFCRHIWAEISRLFWTFLSGTFFPGLGGGVHVHPVHPSCVRACFSCS